MIARLTTAAAASALLFAAAPAIAQEVEHDAIEAKNLEKGKQSISAERAYIFVSGPARSNGLFYKTPTEEDLTVFQEEWEEEYADARKKYERKLEEYLGQQEKLRSGVSDPYMRKLDKPDEVTRETFSIGSVERRLTVGWGPMYVFDKGKDDSGEKTFSYLMEVDPGEYTYYGPIFMNPNGSAMGTCMCMGSVKFEAKAGVVTNLGDFTTLRWVDDEAGRLVDVNWDEIADKRPPVRPVDYSVPAALADYDVVRADLRAAGKVDNWYGIMISRLPPVDGVLAYERDRIVDLKEKSRMQAQAAARPSPVAVSTPSAAPAQAAAQEDGDTNASSEKATASEQEPAAN